MKFKPQSSATVTERMASSRVICRNSCPSEEAPKPSTGNCKPVLPKVRCCIRRGLFNRETPSRQDFLDHLSMDVRESPVAAIVAVGQFFMVDTEQVKNRGMQVVTIGLARNRLPGPLVALAVGDAAFDARAGQP